MTAMAKRKAVERAALIRFAGRDLLIDRAGIAFDLESQTLIAADLHLEKAEAFARRGQLLPPYDSLATLRRLQEVTAHYAPQRIVLLGDSFHRADSALQSASPEMATIEALAGQANLVWISGNHDPAPPADVPGVRAEVLALGQILLRHMPGRVGAQAEMFGHFHPVARLQTRIGSRCRKCAVLSQNRLLLPAFGAFTGGLDVCEVPIAPLFADTAAIAYLMTADAVHPVPLHAL